MPTDAPDLLTTPEVARILDKSPRTVHRMVAAGDLPIARRLPGPNGALLYRAADVEALLTAERRAS